ncbi:uncharacterized protein [Palaemon carinicauda]|uniref:uncharacterized protein n=1 Tax=Palaemon carinicauda TaxID=392227 RepID=UPI0035B5F881
MCCGGEILNIISAYAPQVGCTEEEKENFWRDMDGVMQELEIQERVIVRTDLNGHVGTVMRRHGKELLGETSGIIWEEKESWWWSEEIEKVVKDKNEAKKRWKESQSGEDKGRIKHDNQAIKD